jgi:hypothetical protein
MKQDLVEAAPSQAASDALKMETKTQGYQSAGGVAVIFWSPRHGIMGYHFHSWFGDKRLAPPTPPVAKIP